ncbi:MAG TPA: hypothetical protein ENJ08_02560 [Gammaproteobacteria bacterium]|nr:hypothetical protein [Gammaproteobacteria bacterium]
MFINKQKNRKRMHRKQGGFVLVLVLVLLTVMTLIGVSSMNSANMELKATANARQHQRAFNNVYSLLEYTFSGGAKTTANKLINYQTTDSNLTQFVVSPNVSNPNSLAKVVYVGCSSGVGSSLVAGKGVSYNFYNIVANDSSAVSTVASEQNRGARYPSASCGTL